jgi:hypothetical protein
MFIFDMSTMLWTQDSKHGWNPFILSSSRSALGWFFHKFLVGYNHKHDDWKVINLCTLHQFPFKEFVFNNYKWQCFMWYFCNESNKNISLNFYIWIPCFFYTSLYLLMIWGSKTKSSTFYGWWWTKARAFKAKERRNRDPPQLEETNKQLSWS